MRLGASIWGFYYQQEPATWPTLAGAVNKILSLGKDVGVEVWGSKALEHPPVEGQELVDLVDACQDAAFVTVHIQGRRWSWSPVTLRREIDFVHQLGAGTLVIHPVCLGLTDFEDRPDWPEIVRIADYAAKFGVRLAVENIFDSVWCLDRILEELGDDPEDTNVGICIDTGHAAVSHDAGRDSVCNYLERYAAQLCHLHLHDNLGAHDDHLLPGAGTIDWQRVRKVLTNIGFEGTAVLEARQAGVLPHDVAKRGLVFFR
jgi:sugar phosphate isomerase/epimerase